MPGTPRLARFSPLALIAALALAVGAAPCAPARAAEAEAPLPPFEVIVESTGAQSDVAVMPVEFLAPLVDEEAAGGGTCYLKSPDGRAHLCQYELLPRGEGGLGYAWARFSALLPNRDAGYVFGRTSELVPGAMPAVSTLLAPDAIVLDSGSLKVTLDPWKCEVVKAASFGEQLMVPRSYEGLLNRQQGLRVTVMDRIRRVDFVLEPLARSGKWEPVTLGAVATTLAYKGVLMCPSDIPPTAFEARVTLTAGGMMELGLDLSAAALDREVYAFKEVEITLPLVLERAATLSFGGLSGAGRGRSYWSGKASLAAAADGSYRFVDGDGIAVSGSARLSWADYSDGERGLAMLWKPGTGAVLDVDYREDLLTLRLPLPDAPARLALHFLFHQGPGDPALLGSAAGFLESPPSATAGDAYVAAATQRAR